MRCRCASIRVESRGCSTAATGDRLLLSVRSKREWQTRMTTRCGRLTSNHFLNLPLDTDPLWQRCTQDLVSSLLDCMPHWARAGLRALTGHINKPDSPSTANLRE